MNKKNDNENIINTINNDEINRTPIQDFYAEQILFITGATGFLGKALIEKLLRTCPNVAKIYILVRPKKQKNINDRIEDTFNDPIFHHLKIQMPKFRDKIVAISGDCSLSNLGLAPKDRESLIDEVTIVFHGAATVNFDEKLKLAVSTNVGSVVEIINLCKKMKNLKVMMHVSTAYANCNRVDTINEQIYTHPYEYEDLRAMTNSFSDQALDATTPTLLDRWPNTYTFTKALGEHVIKQRCNDMPIGIFRPAILTSSADEPLPGWVDNCYGAMGVMVFASAGILRVMYLPKIIKADLVPIDYTANALLASAWDVANKTDRRGENMLIYNYVSTMDSNLTWTEYMQECVAVGHNYPIENTIWYFTLTGMQSEILFAVVSVFVHLLPSILIDAIAICLWQKPKMLKSYSRMRKLLRVLHPFITNNWTYKTDNIQQLWLQLDPRDKHNFKFTFEHFDWKRYIRDHMIGLKQYLFRENLDDLEVIRKKMQKWRWAHEGVKIIVVLLLFIFICKIFSCFI